MSGLNREFLEKYLKDAGFINIQRVKDFGFFQDSSTRCYKDKPISLNLIAEKPV